MKCKNHKNHITRTMIFLSMISLPHNALHAQLMGTDTMPGSACFVKGAIRMTANESGAGAYVLTCNGDDGTWVATINTTLPITDEQVANKYYVDNAIRGSVEDCLDNDETLCLLAVDRMTSDPDLVANNIAQGINILGKR